MLYFFFGYVMILFRLTGFGRIAEANYNRLAMLRTFDGHARISQSHQGATRQPEMRSGVGPSP
jgi:hypothetical protein